MITESHIPNFSDIHDETSLHSLPILFYNFYEHIPSEFVLRVSKKDKEKLVDMIKERNFIPFRTEATDIFDTITDTTYYRNDVAQAIIKVYNRRYADDDDCSLESEAGMESAACVSSAPEEDDATIYVYYFFLKNDINEAFIAEIEKLRFIETKKNSIYVFEKRGDQLVLTPYPITGFELDVTKHYNDDFKEVDSEIDKWINDFSIKNNRLCLLHGEAGSGKSNYIMNLLTKNIDTKKIYLPPYLISAISDPTFFSIITKHKNSVLVCEDFEKMLVSREASDNDGIQILLNMTDGILGGILNFKIICTFNTDESKIDEALKRKGRLFKKYKFTNLSEEKTKNLFKELYGEDAVPPAREMSLAAIYNLDDNGVIKREQRKIGF